MAEQTVLAPMGQPPVEQAPDPFAELGGNFKISSMPEGISVEDGISALKNVASAHKEELQSNIDAAIKNNSVVQALEIKTDALDKDTLDILGNEQKIARWGGNNGVTKLLGLFDSTFNSDYQTARLRTNQVKAAQVADTAKTQIAVNNQTPAIKKLQSELAAQDFDLQEKAFGLVNKDREIKQGEWNVRLSATRLLMDLDKNQREQLQQAAVNMSEAQRKQAMKDADKGIGPWAGKKGILEHIDLEETKAHEALRDLQLGMQKKRQDLIDAAQMKLAMTIQPIQMDPIIRHILKTGAMEVEVRKGVVIPSNVLMTAYNENKKLTAGAQLSIQADDAAQISEKMNIVGIASNALATLDPEGVRISERFARAAAKYDPKDYASGQEFSIFLDSIAAQQKEVAKRISSQMGDPQAKAAVEGFIATGRFTPEGGEAVVNGISGNYFAQRNTKFAPAFALSNKMIADAVARANIDGAPAYDQNSSNEVQVSTMMAYITRNTTNKKIQDIKNEVLASPGLQKDMAAEVSSVIRTTARTQVLATFANATGAEFFWRDILEHPDQFNNEQGSFSYALLARRLAQEQAKKGPGGPNYNASFVTALKNAAAGAISNPMPDPTKTMHDYALEAKLMGGPAEPAALNDFAQIFQSFAEQAQKEIRAAIASDLQGANQVQTQLPAMGIGMDDPEGRSLTQKYLTAPSDTGSGQTKEQVQQLYGMPPTEAAVTPRVISEKERQQRHYDEWRQKYYGR